jgi:UDP-3-O-[3-hydroxymyristoyl] glucosamine N-acyltransferase
MEQVVDVKCLLLWFGKNVVIWNYVVIGDNTQMGDNTRKGSFCDIGRDLTVGDNCIIQAYVTISNGRIIGNKFSLDQTRAC